jgi:hypothetical protein
MADHRLPMRARDVEAFARDLAGGLGIWESNAGSGVAAITPPPLVAGSNWLPALVRDLQKHRGACIVIAGEQQPPAVHALAHAMNDILGNVGKTVDYTAPVEANPVNAAGINQGAGGGHPGWSG